MGKIRNILDKDIKFGIMKILYQLWNKFHDLQWCVIPELLLSRLMVL